jgi:hypothetical protein
VVPTGGSHFFRQLAEVGQGAREPEERREYEDSIAITGFNIYARKAWTAHPITNVKVFPTAFPNVRAPSSTHICFFCSLIC